MTMLSHSEFWILSENWSKILNFSQNPEVLEASLNGNYNNFYINFNKNYKNQTVKTEYHKSFTR